MQNLMADKDSGGVQRGIYVAVLAIMVLLPISVTAYKLYGLDYPLAGLIPAPTYKVELSMQIDGHGEDINVHTYLPRTDSRQSIENEQNSPGVFASELKSDP